jgi:xanthine dehydrogenase small subunit
MISFILNNQLILSDLLSGSSLLDFIRYDMDLPGTKCGCREGDCGACTVLEGTFSNGRLSYKSIVSCLTPLANVHGKHIVTIEGLNMQHLTPIQNAVVMNSATQCGFCTPGVVMSLTSFCLSSSKPELAGAVASVGGNICRCTGYKSIERAAAEISGLIHDKSITDPVAWLVGNKFLPEYFLTITERLTLIPPHSTVNLEQESLLLAGGTDLMVKRASELLEKNITTLSDRIDLKGITSYAGRCKIGASSTITEIADSKLITENIPGFASFMKLIASEQVRNTGTLAGNIVNASPAADLTIIFLALGASLTIAGKNDRRRILQLKEFFKGYKITDLGKDEYISSISFRLHGKPALFNFEKVSRRTHLDIASVNSAISITTEGELITGCLLSAGGVAPVPLFLERTCAFLEGKTLTSENIVAAGSIIQEEISPISDIRGSLEYKRLLMRQLFFAHFIKFFPGIFNLEELTQRGTEGTQRDTESY